MPERLIHMRHSEIPGEISDESTGLVGHQIIRHLLSDVRRG